MSNNIIQECGLENETWKSIQKISATDIADKLLKDKKITHKQFEVLSEISFEITDDSPFYKFYDGCGHGWLEFDKDGKLVNMRYSHSLDDEGSSEQNLDNFTIMAEDLEPKILDNGNVRVLVNINIDEMIVRF